MLGRQVVPHVRAERYGSFEHLFLRPFVRVHAGSAPAVADATDGGGDDLLSALFAALGTQPARLPAPKEVVLIQLAAAAPTHDTSPKERKRFTYPTRMYIDPFLSECESLTTGCRARRVAALEGIAALEARKKEITRFEVSIGTVWTNVDSADFAIRGGTASANCARQCITLRMSRTLAAARGAGPRSSALQHS